MKMKIKINITSQEFGTEYGEVTPTTYYYQCSEIDSEPVEKNCFTYSEIPDQIVTVPYIKPELKDDFFKKLNNFLNVNYRDWLPGDYQGIVNKIVRSTIFSSKDFSLGAVKGLLFAKSVATDVAPFINIYLTGNDGKNLALSSHATLDAANKEMNDPENAAEYHSPYNRGCGG